MISLYESLLMEAKSIGDIGISFETFRGFVDNDIIACKEVDKLFKKQFGKKYLDMRCLMDETVQRMMIEMSHMGVEIDDVILRFIYEKMKDTSLNKINKIIGSGAEACVFDLGDKIIKCYYNNKIPDHQKRFFDVCKTGKYNIFPKVYRIGKGYVIMEKVTSKTPLIQRLFTALFKEIKGQDGTLYHLVQDKKYDFESLNKIQKQAVLFMEEIRNALKAVTGYDESDFGDFHRDNVGQREDGSLVYFDI